MNHVTTIAASLSEGAQDALKGAHRLSDQTYHRAVFHKTPEAVLGELYAAGLIHGGRALSSLAYEVRAALLPTPSPGESGEVGRWGGGEVSNDPENMLEHLARALIDADPTMEGYHESHLAIKQRAVRAILSALRNPIDGLMDHHSYLSGEWSRRNIESFIDAIRAGA